MKGLFGDRKITFVLYLDLFEYIWEKIGYEYKDRPIEG